MITKRVATCVDIKTKLALRESIITLRQLCEADAIDTSDVSIASDASDFTSTEDSTKKTSARSSEFSRMVALAKSQQKNALDRLFSIEEENYFKSLSNTPAERERKFKDTETGVESTRLESVPSKEQYLATLLSTKLLQNVSAEQFKEKFPDVLSFSLKSAVNQGLMLTKNAFLKSICRMFLNATARYNDQTVAGMQGSLANMQNWYNLVTKVDLAKVFNELDTKYITTKDCGFWSVNTVPEQFNYMASALATVSAEAATAGKDSDWYALYVIICGEGQPGSKVGAPATGKIIPSGGPNDLAKIDFSKEVDPKIINSTIYTAVESFKSDDSYEEPEEEESKPATAQKSRTPEDIEKLNNALKQKSELDARSIQTLKNQLVKGANKLGIELNADALKSLDSNPQFVDMFKAFNTINKVK